MAFSLHLGWLLAAFLVLAGLTFLFPCLAAAVALLRTRQPAPRPAKPGPPRLEIFLPAYNEADTLERTLASIDAACERALRSDPQARIRITVALDGPTDGTAALARKAATSRAEGHPEIRVLDRAENRGKWATIRELVDSLESGAQDAAPWVALVDCGTLWPEDLLTEMRAPLSRTDLVGVAPGYRQGDRAGLLERLVWWQERALKELENLAGGPVSLHGATMLFRGGPLKAAVADLGERPWLNDDVVLALAMRTRGPILYLGSLCVSDCGVRGAGSAERTRRRRMLQGNLEWIRDLYPRMARLDPVVGLLALRRIQRVLWAYSVLLFGGMLTLGLTGSSGTAAACTGGTMILMLINPRLRQASLVSLATPFLLFQKRPVSWG